MRICDEYYGAIFHLLSVNPDGTRVYLNIPYLFEAGPPWQIKHIRSVPLKLPLNQTNEHGQERNGMFVFTSGLAFVDGRLVVSYNLADSSASFYVDTVPVVFSELIEVVE